MKRREVNLFKVVSLYFTGCALLFSACRKDPKPIPEVVESIFAAEPSSIVKGFYLLNEGNMNMNKASIDYVDFTKGLYRRNIYNEINPEVTKGLGDVGTSIGVYGSKLYVVINRSNKVEILNVKTGKRIKQIDITNCRYITFHKNKAYVSAYLGEPGATSGDGNVSEIDTATLIINRQVNVGRQPEELAVVGEKLYVANSGGLSPENYERTVSVIDINSFTEIKRIDVGINLHRLKVDKYGDIYVTSRGDYYDIPPNLYLIDTEKDELKKAFNFPVGNIVIDDDTAYIVSASFSYATGKNTISYRKLNVKDETLLESPFITDGTQEKIKLPYGIAVNPATKEVFLTDAKDYVTPGTLYCFDSSGRKKWSVTTGDIPAHFAFVY